MVQILRSTERISSFKCNTVIHLIRVVGMADPSSCQEASTSRKPSAFGFDKWRCADCGKCFKGLRALKMHQQMSERCASGASEEKTTQPSSDMAAESSGESMFYCNGRLV
jgi:hypothetical protein